MVSAIFGLENVPHSRAFYSSSLTVWSTSSFRFNADFPSKRRAKNDANQCLTALTSLPNKHKSKESNVISILKR